MATPDRFRSHQLPRAAAVTGAVIAAASLVVPWTTIGYMTVQDRPARTLTIMIDSPYFTGLGYVFPLVLLVTTLVLALFGSESVRRTARLAALTLAGITAVLVCVALYRLSNHDLLVETYGFADDAKLIIRLKPGGFLAAGSAVLFGLAAWLSSSSDEPGAEEYVDDEYDEPEYGDGIEVIDLTVKAG